MNNHKKTYKKGQKITNYPVEKDDTMFQVIINDDTSNKTKKTDTENNISKNMTKETKNENYTNKIDEINTKPCPNTHDRGPDIFTTNDKRIDDTIDQLYGEISSDISSDTKYAPSDSHSYDTEHYSIDTDHVSSDDIDLLIARRQDADIYNEHRATLADFISCEDDTSSDTAVNKFSDEYSEFSKLKSKEEIYSASSHEKKMEYGTERKNTKNSHNNGNYENNLNENRNETSQRKSDYLNQSKSGNFNQRKSGNSNEQKSDEIENTNENIEIKYSCFDTQETNTHKKEYTNHHAVDTKSNNSNNKNTKTISKNNFIHTEKKGINSAHCAALKTPGESLNLSLTSSQVYFSDFEPQLCESTQSSEITGFSSFLTQNGEDQNTEVFKGDKKSPEWATTIDFTEDPNKKVGSKDKSGVDSITDENNCGTISIENSDILDSHDNYAGFDDDKNEHVYLQDEISIYLDSDNPMAKRPHLSENDSTLFLTSFTTANKKRISINRSTYEKEQRKNREIEEQEENKGMDIQ